MKGIQSIKIVNLFSISRMSGLISRQKDTLYFLGASFGGAVLSFLLLPVFTHYLAVEDFGIIGFALALNAFVAPLFNLCLNSYYIREYNRKHADSRKPAELLSVIILFSFLWSIVLLALLALTVPAAFRQFGVQVSFYPVLLVLLTNVFQLPFVYYLLELRMQRKARQYFLVSLFQSLLCLVIPLLFVIWYEASAVSRLEGYSIAFLLVGLVSLGGIRRSLGLHFDKKIISKALKFSSPLVLYTLACLAFDFADRYFVEQFNTLRELGFYNVAFQFSNLVYVFSLAIYRAYEPSYYSLYHAGDHNRLNRMFDYTNYVIWGAGIATLLVLPIIVDIFTSKDYSVSVKMGRWLILATILQSVNMVYQTYFAIANQTLKLMMVSIFVLLLFLAAGWYLSSAYGFMGTIYAKIAAQVVILVISYFSYYHRLRQSTSFYGSLVLAAALFLLLFFYNA